MGATGRFPVSRTPAEWRRLLNAEQYRVGVQEGTERPWSSPLNAEHRRGVFHCVGCSSPLFASEDKFESGTGWPSFTRPVGQNRVATRLDFKLIYPRTECHCATCGLHLGHVFADGPRPTGQRWCINGVVMVFRPR